MAIRASEVPSTAGASTRTLRVTLSPAQPVEESRTIERILQICFFMTGLLLTLLKYAGGSQTSPYESSVTLSEVEGCNSLILCFDSAQHDAVGLNSFSQT